MKPENLNAERAIILVNRVHKERLLKCVIVAIWITCLENLMQFPIKQLMFVVA
jgi:hypothetical protein